MLRVGCSSVGRENKTMNRLWFLPILHSKKSHQSEWMKSTCKHIFSGLAKYIDFGMEGKYHFGPVKPNHLILYVCFVPYAVCGKLETGVLIRDV